MNIRDFTQTFTKQEVLGAIKGRMIQAYFDACNESFLEYLYEKVQESEKEEYCRGEVNFLLNASADTSIREIKETVKKREIIASLDPVF